MPGKVKKSEAEWRRELTPMQYAVLREKATERPFSGEYEHEERRAPTHAPAAARRCSNPTPSSIPAAAGRVLPRRRPTAMSMRSATQPRHGPHRSAVLEVRRPSRPCLRGRPWSDRLALLHQLGRAETAAEIEDRWPFFPSPLAREGGADEVRAGSFAGTKSRDMLCFLSGAADIHSPAVLGRMPCRSA